MRRDACMVKEFQPMKASFGAQNHDFYASLLPILPTLLVTIIGLAHH